MADRIRLVLVDGKFIVGRITEQDSDILEDPALVEFLSVFGQTQIGGVAVKGVVSVQLLGPPSCRFAEDVILLGDEAIPSDGQKGSSMLEMYLAVLRNAGRSLSRVKIGA